MSAWEFAHWIAIENWLTDYYPDVNATNLDKVRSYLEAFHHLCELSEWKKSLKILFLDTSFLGGKKVLHEQLFIWGYYQEQVNLYKRLLNRFGLETDCLLISGLGRAYGYLGKIEDAISSHEQQLSIAAKINNYAAEAEAHGGLARIYVWHLEQYQESIYHYQQQLKLSRIIKDKSQEASAIFGIATAYLGCLDYQKAIKFANQALSIVQTLQDVEMEINILGFIGAVYSQIGLAKKGISFLEKQLKLSQEMGNKYQEALALSRLGLSYSNLREDHISLDYYQKSLNIIEVLGEPSHKAKLLSNLGVSCYQIGQYYLAIEYLKFALNISFLMNSKYQEVHVRLNLAYCYSCLKQSEAFVHINAALNLARNMKSPELLGLALAGLANVYWQQGNYIYGLILILKSMWVDPPWKSHNGMRTLRAAIQVLSKSFIQTMQKCSIYLRGNHK